MALTEETIVCKWSGAFNNAAQVNATADVYSFKPLLISLRCLHQEDIL
jgi:hypothetical protein